MAGENPAQSVAMAAAAGRLFGMQLNDAHVKLGAEDGLAFAAVHPTAALELVRALQRAQFDGHIYFDTFPRKEDPVGVGAYTARQCQGGCPWSAAASARPCPCLPLQVREAELNIATFKRLWRKAARLAAAGIDSFAATHDAMGALELLAADDEAGEAAATAATTAAAASA